MTAPRPSTTTLQEKQSSEPTFDQHWNFDRFRQADAAETVVAVHLCAYGDVLDGGPRPRPRPLRLDQDRDVEMELRMIGEEDDTVPDMDEYDEFYASPPPNHWALFLGLAAEGEMTGGGGGQGDDGEDGGQGDGDGGNGGDGGDDDDDGVNDNPSSRRIINRAVKLDMSPGYQPGRPFREGTIIVSSVTESAQVYTTTTNDDDEATNDNDKVGNETKNRIRISSSNMMPSLDVSYADGTTGAELIVKSLPFLLLAPNTDTDSDTDTDTTTRTRTTITVAQVLDLLRLRGRHRYLLSEKGEGSRYWAYTVMEDLERAEYLAHGEAVRAADALCRVWGPNGEQREQGDGGDEDEGEIDRDGDRNLGRGEDEHEDGHGNREREGAQRLLCRGMFTNWTIRGLWKKKRRW